MSALFLVAAALALGWSATQPAVQAAAPLQLFLLVSDTTPDSDVMVLAWLDAAAEAGFALQTVKASALMRDHRATRQFALIVPDAINLRMSEALVAHLETRVKQGARLMLVHDAGIAGMDGRYHPQQSRLSALAGVRYGLYGEYGSGMLSEQGALVDAASVAQLRLPPGKVMRANSDSPLTSVQAAPSDDEDLSVVTYHYGRLRYPVFRTEGPYAGRRLMHAEGGSLLAGVHAVGAGEVLFVNLPLTYLKLRTDAFFLHAFLRYFAQERVGLPQLSPMPDAQGALIMNWHIDSASAEPALSKLEALGAFEQGPYSVHLTAGPDVDVPGDGLGMDLANNKSMQTWARRFANRGDEIGSHGGWIHNEFGRLIGTQDRAQSTAMIEHNSAVVSSASGKPVREYSAPTGNHPAWVTPWLRERGILAYYFTGDIGMPPTRSYQDGQRGPTDSWAFPVLSYGSYAAFEEASQNKVPQAHVAAWLNDVADFCADTRTVRLMYFHPPGIALFPEAFAAWMQHTRELVVGGRLRWTTMAAHTEFSNRRLAAQWHWQADSRAGAAPDALQLQAEHPHSLEHLSWLLAADRYAQPRLLEGQAEVLRDGPYWRVTAGRTTRLVLDTHLLRPNGAPAPEPARL